VQKGGCILFSGNVYAYGIINSGKGAKLSVYKISTELKMLDSLVMDLGKHSLEDFLLTSSDTLHGYLNIYLQRKEKKLVTVARFNRQFKLIANIENVDIARLNSISAFQEEIFYNEQDVYNIKISNSDSAGRQFFLNKYTLKSDQKNFEYDQKWQFPFERKNIHSAHIIGVVKNQVVLYVNIIEGQKAGQWILKIDRRTGTLVRGTKIGNKGDTGFYSFGAIEADTALGSVYIIGQKFAVTELSQKENKIANAGKPFATVYLANIDSTGEMVTREEFKMPVTETKGNKTANAYILKQYNFQKTAEGNFIFTTDIYKGSGLGCYAYCNTLSNTITLVDEKLTLDKSAVTSNSVIEKYYFTADKSDMNGKICSDSLADFEKIYYKHIPLPVKVAFKQDGSGIPAWIVKKSDTKKMTEDLTVVRSEKKILQAQKLEEIGKSENPQVLVISKERFFITRQITFDKLELKLLTW
jgi:hypothetical protein